MGINLEKDLQALAAVSALSDLVDSTTADIGQRAINPRAAPYNAKGDLKSVQDGVMSSVTNPTHLSSVSYTFTSADVGKKVKVCGAAAAGANLKTTISSVTAGKAVLASPCLTTVTAAITIFVTDDTAALQAAFDAAAVADAVARTVDLGTGRYGITQIVFPRRAAVKGVGTMGNFAYLYQVNYEYAANTILYQLWDQNQDACRFTEVGAGLGTWQGQIDGFIVNQDLDNSSGVGISFRTVTDDAVTLIDGAKVRDISVQGFAGHGWEVPGGSVPAVFERCHSMGNLGAGMKYTCHAGVDSVHFDSFGGDWNTGGLLHLVGQGGSGTGATIEITNMKSEFGDNRYRDPGGAAKQSNAIIFESMDSAQVIVNGLRHHTVGGFTGIGAALYVPTGSIPPTIVWDGVNVYPRSPQTNATAYIFQDVDNGYSVSMDSNLGGSGGWSSGHTEITGNSGGVGRRVLGNSSSFVASSVFGESPGDMLIGTQPVHSFANVWAAPGKKHLAWVQLSDGTLRLRGLTSALAVETDEGIIVRRNAPGIAVEIQKLITPDYKRLMAVRNRLSAPIAQTATLAEAGGGSAAGANGADGVFYLDPADFSGTDRTAKLRLRASVVTNAVAPASDFTFGLYPVTAAGGGATAVNTTLGTVVSGSTAAVVAPGATSMPTAVSSGDFTCPAAGFYIIAVVISASNAANSAVALRAFLDCRVIA